MTPDTSNSREWYWRANDAQRLMTIGHGTAGSRDGMVDQVAALLRHSRHIAASVDGRGIEIVIQPPESRR